MVNDRLTSVHRCCISQLWAPCYPLCNLKNANDLIVQSEPSMNPLNLASIHGPSPAVYFKYADVFDVDSLGNKLVPGCLIDMRKFFQNLGFDVLLEESGDAEAYYVRRKGLVDDCMSFLVATVQGVGSNVIAELFLSLTNLRKSSSRPGFGSGVYIAHRQRHSETVYYRSEGTQCDAREVQLARDQVAAASSQAKRSRNLVPPSDLFPTPLFDSHKMRLVGWGKRPRRSGGKTIIDEAIVTDSEVEKRIAESTPVGFSCTLSVEKSCCSICSSPYNSCNHIQGKKYKDKTCSVQISKGTVLEVSIVSSPINRDCKISVKKFGA